MLGGKGKRGFWPRPNHFCLPDEEQGMEVGYGSSRVLLELLHNPLLSSPFLYP